MEAGGGAEVRMTTTDMNSFINGLIVGAFVTFIVGTLILEDKPRICHCSDGTTIIGENKSE